jgi:hypothetical protein
MTTEKQQRANERNARLSIGPGEEGKLKTRWNALTTGAYSSNLLPGEDPAAYSELESSLIDYYKPADPRRSFLVQLLAMTIWRLLRVLNAESAALTLAVLEAQAEREHRAGKKYEPTKLPGELGTALILSEEEHVYRDGRRLERESGVDPLHAALGHAFVQDALDSDVLTKIGGQIKRLEGSIYRLMQELDD